LGLKLINGRAEQLRFGGQVMKNVAGFDVSRLQAGALGSFGVISEITVKVLPKPPSTLTLVRESPAGAAIVEMNELARQPKPLTGAAWVAGRLYLRLAGAESAVAGTAAQWGGERLADGDGFWHELNEQRLPFFDPGRPLWRFSVTSTAPLAELDGEWLLDWAGAQRFIHGDFDRTRLESLAMAAGGHVSLFRGGDRNAEVFTELEAPIKRLHLRLKRAFDPDRVLNPGRMYSWL
jgi:glycolate oxidase FAD binding subunit